LAIARERDATWFAAVRRRRIAATQAQAWLDEPSDPVPAFAEAWMGERLFSGAFTDEVLGTGLTGYHSHFRISPPTWQDSVQTALAYVNPVAYWNWATVPAGLAYSRWNFADFEAQMRG